MSTLKRDPGSKGSFTGFRMDPDDLMKTVDLAHAMARRLDGTILFCTSGICQLYGWSREEMVGASSHQLLATEFPKPLDEIDAELLRDGQWSGELRHRRKDGSAVWVASHWALRRGEQGCPATVIEVNNDTTEVRRALNELWKQQEAFRALAENSTDAIERIDRESRHIYLNSAAVRMLGLSFDQVNGKNDCGFGLANCRSKAWEERFRRVIENDQSLEIDDWLETPGGLKFFNTRCVPEHAADGSVISVLAVSRDITRHELAERAVRESESRERARAAELQAIMDAVPAAVFMVADPGCKKMTGNRMTYDLLRIPYGSDLSTLVPDGFENAGFRVVTDDTRIQTNEFPVQCAARSRQSCQNYEFDLVFDSGERLSLRGNVVPLSNDTKAPHGAVGAFLNVTELRVSQHLLEKSRDRQRALSDLLLTAQDDERRRIAQDLHDDLCQRLAIVAFEIRTLAAEGPLEPVVLSDRINGLHGRVVGISEDIRRVAYQLHPSALDDLGLKTALQVMCDEVRQMDRLKVRFATRGDPDSLPREIISCLYRVTQEAISNICRHARARRVVVSVAVLRAQVQLAIKDDGCGFRLDGRKHGLGILSMEERVMRVKGEMRIATEIGKGTRIMVSIPLLRV